MSCYQGGTDTRKKRERKQQYTSSLKCAKMHEFLGTLLNMHIIFPSTFLSLYLDLPDGGSAKPKHAGNYIV